MRVWPVPSLYHSTAADLELHALKDSKRLDITD